MSAATIDDVRRARRILCVGATGAGKSTMAEALGERLGLPAVQLDEFCWDPGWLEAPDDEQLRRVLPIIRSERWVLDSLPSSQAAHAWHRIDAIVALDDDRHVSLSRLIRRTAPRIRTRERICNGNVETLRVALSPDSIWHFRSWRSKRERMPRWHADASAPPVLLLSRPADAEALLAQLARLVPQTDWETPIGGRRGPARLLRIEGCPRHRGAADARGMP